VTYWHHHNSVRFKCRRCGTVHSWRAECGWGKATEKRIRCCGELHIRERGSWTSPSDLSSQSILNRKLASKPEEARQ